MDISTWQRLWNPISFITSLFLALLLIMALTPETVLTTFIVLGHGHFALAYMYQWRAGKVGLWYSIRMLVVAAVLLLGLVYIPDPASWGLVVAGALFAAHFFVDEYFIGRDTQTFDSYLLGAGFTALYTALLVKNTYSVQWPLVTILIALVLCAPAIYKLYKTPSREPVLSFMLSGTVVFLIFFLVPMEISTEKVAGFIILMHFIRWYLFAGVTNYYHNDPHRFSRYIIDVVSVNLLFVFLFFTLPVMATIGLEGIGHAEATFNYLFSSEYFYMWTILHIVSSVRIPESLYARFVR